MICWLLIFVSPHFSVHLVKDIVGVKDFVQKVFIVPLMMMWKKHINALNLSAFVLPDIFALKDRKNLFCATQDNIKIKYNKWHVYLVLKDLFALCLKNYNPQLALEDHFVHLSVKKCIHFVTQVDIK